MTQDDEEGDMYEAPPCERPAVKVPQRQVQQNVYLGKMNPAEVKLPTRLLEVRPDTRLPLREDVQPSCSSEAGGSSSQTAGKTCSSQCRRSVTVSSELLHSFELNCFNTNTSHPNANQSCAAVRNSVTNRQRTNVFYEMCCILFVSYF